MIALALVPFALARVQHTFFGLPYIAPSTASLEGAPSGPDGFRVWIRWSHFFNLIFLFMLIRSGLSILMDHPRLYLNDHCTPGTERIRFTLLTVPKDRIWTTKDDARYISPVVAMPGYRHTVGVARSWALHQRLWLRIHGCFLRLRFDDQKPMAAAGADLSRGLRPSLEHVRPLCDVSRSFPGGP